MTDACQFETEHKVFENVWMWVDSLISRGIERFGFRLLLICFGFVSIIDLTSHSRYCMTCIFHGPFNEKMNQSISETK